MGATVAAIGIGINVLGAAGAADQNRKAAAAQNAALLEQQKAARLKNIMTRRAEARKAQRLMAENRNRAASGGATVSSSLNSTLSAIQSTSQSRISFLDTLQTYDINRFNLQRTANDHIARAGDYQALSSVGSSIFSAAGGPDALSKLF